MAISSFSGKIQTDNEFVTVSSLTDFTFTEGKTYSMQIQNTGYLKLADAIFCFRDEKFQFKQGSEDLYIRTPDSFTCLLTILEDE